MYACVCVCVSGDERPIHEESPLERAAADARHAMLTYGPGTPEAETALEALAQLVQQVSLCTKHAWLCLHTWLTLKVLRGHLQHRHLDAYSLPDMCAPLLCYVYTLGIHLEC